MVLELLTSCFASKVGSLVLVRILTTTHASQWNRYQFDEKYKLSSHNGTWIVVETQRIRLFGLQGKWKQVGVTKTAKYELIWPLHRRRPVELANTKFANKPNKFRLEPPIKVPFKTRRRPLIMLQQLRLTLSCRSQGRRLKAKIANRFRSPN